MQASEAKYITEQAEIKNANEWWEKFSVKLFETIKRQAECRCYILQITDNDNKLNEFGWISSKSLRDKAKQELEVLGYKFSFVDAQQGAYVDIVW